MKKSYRPLAYLVLLLFLFLSPTLIHARGTGDPGDPGGSVPNPDCPPDDVCPIDGGLTALIAIGVGYGIKKIRDNKKPESIS